MRALASNQYGPGSISAHVRVEFVVPSYLAPGGWGRDSLIKSVGCSSSLGVKKVFLVPRRVFNLKKPTAGALAVPFRY